MKLKKLFFIFFSLSLIIISCNKQNKQTSDNTSSTAVANETVSVAEQQSRKLHDKLMSSFNPNWETEETATTAYPAYYGGSFIDNNGKFVVCIAGNPDEYRSHIANIIGTNDFLTEKCTYSYREMMQVMDKLDAFLSDSSIPTEHPFLSYFAGAGADVLENRVVIQLTEMNDAAIKAFKKDVSDSPIVSFKKGELPMMY